MRRLDFAADGWNGRGGREKESEGQGRLHGIEDAPAE
ncbi:hypothetical protein MexAM1_META2p1277 (plasmid) [Methylorubrum extorquens AM1]|uniref:Uncharacterized protein n=1 Tax=Methylorubrum extorquens (strain ATCC 14718 / DSM 1338 / JCM 2805 / NCIMB 9133 / AM1) TaxID=272630 RepID=C5B6D6_METEA|nr:hypothetical protein MexAM1_META2p1277 [Methylorubrum extorquens AM1]